MPGEAPEIAREVCLVCTWSNAIAPALSSLVDYSSFLLLDAAIPHVPPCGNAPEVSFSATCRARALAGLLPALRLHHPPAPSPGRPRRAGDARHPDDSGRPPSSADRPDHQHGSETQATARE